MNWVNMNEFYGSIGIFRGSLHIKFRFYSVKSWIFFEKNVEGLLFYKLWTIKFNIILKQTA